MKMKLGAVIIISLYFSTISSISYAAKKLNTDYPKWSIGANIGITDPNASAVVNNALIDESATDYDNTAAIDLNMAYYFDPKVGVSASAGSILGVEAKNSSVDAFSIHHFNTSIVGYSTSKSVIRYSISLGVGYYLFDTDLASHNKFGAMFGFNGYYPLSDKVELSLGYQFHKIDSFSDDTGTLSIEPQALTFGVNFRI